MFDLTITGGTVVDGTGSERFRADIGVKDGIVEGVEDIPGSALAEGITWEWESFPQYQEAVEAGALGFSTSRTEAHRAIDGEVVPGTYAAEAELFGRGRAMAAGGQRHGQRGRDPTPRCGYRSATGSAAARGALSRRGHPVS